MQQLHQTQLTHSAATYIAVILWGKSYENYYAEWAIKLRQNFYRKYLQDIELDAKFPQEQAASVATLPPDVTEVLHYGEAKTSATASIVDGVSLAGDSAHALEQ